MTPQDPLKSYFEHERQNWLEPDPDFAGRVMAGVRRRVTLQPVTLWDGVFAFARPVAAVALLMLITIVVLNSYLPLMPAIGAVDAYLEAEASPGERWLFSEDEPPVGPDLYEEVLLAEEK